MEWKTDLYSGWGHFCSATGEIARPESYAALTALPPAPALGARRSYGDAALNTGGRVIDMTRLDRFLKFDPETGELDVEAGIRIADILAVFLPRGWMLPVVPGTGFATVGGCIAFDVHGKNHHVAGSFAQHVSRITLLSHGRVHFVMPDTPLFHATAGGLGQTGVIISARIRMVPTTARAMRVRERRAKNWQEHLAFLDDADADYCVGWIDATAKGAALGRGIVEEAEESEDMQPDAKGSPRVPFDAPSFLLSPHVVRAFNRSYFKRIPAEGRTRIRRVEDFFFPLDRLRDWYRLYGKQGFHQFQCVVPTEGVSILRQILDRIAASKLASPLAVLKKMGPGRAGFMSFPMQGYSLAVDFPESLKARSLIGQLGGHVLDAGGRIYLAKDALSTPEIVQPMYPARHEWLAEVTRLDPTRAFETDLVRRLHLRDPS